VCPVALAMMILAMVRCLLSLSVTSVRQSVVTIDVCPGVVSVRAPVA